MTVPSVDRSQTLAPSGPAGALHEAAAEFEALLFKEVFAPLSRSMGFYGDEVVGAAARAMLGGASAGLTDPLEAAISSAARSASSRNVR
jgi:hypothetical protein